MALDQPAEVPTETPKTRTAPNPDIIAPGRLNISGSASMTRMLENRQIAAIGCN